MRVSAKSLTKNRVGLSLTMIRIAVVVAMSAALVGIVGITATAWAGGSALYAGVGGSGVLCTVSSPCTLTEALSAATDGETIDLAAGTYQPAIGTSFTLSTSVTIQPTTEGSSVTLEGNGSSVLVVNSSASATVVGMNITDGMGGIVDFGSLRVEDSTISGNSYPTITPGSLPYGGNGGGGIVANGSLTLVDSNVSGNSSDGDGGGIWNGGTATIEDSTISSNTALGAGPATPSGGGGIFNGGTLTVEESTISGNIAGAHKGGGIYNANSATVEASTIARNTAASSSGIFNGDTMTTAADIVANSGGDCSGVGTITDAGYDIDDDGSCGFNPSTGSISNSPLIDNCLGALGSNGGPTETMPLLTEGEELPYHIGICYTDPALQAIPSTFGLPVAVNGAWLACSLPDQRGSTRGHNCDIGAYELASVSFDANGGSGSMAAETYSMPALLTMNEFTRAGYTFAGWNTVADGSGTSYANGATYSFFDSVTLYAQWIVDSYAITYAAPGVVGSGSCTDPTDACLLSTALASATNGGTVDLAAGTYQPTSGSSFTIPNSITVQPTEPGSAVTLEGNGNTVLVVNSPVATATVTGVVIEGGASEAYGGGIANFNGTLTVVDSTITGNTAGWSASSHGYSTTGYGGGLYTEGGTLTVEDSTISGNTATSSGGGILAGDGILNVEDSTISGNTAGDGGGIALFVDTAATVEDSTITANSSGSFNGGYFASGIYADGPVTLAADIIAKQKVGPDCQAVFSPTAITDDGYNVDDDGSCGLSGSHQSDSRLPVIDNYLGALSSNGGPTETVPLLTTPSPTTSLQDPALGVIPSSFHLPVSVNGASLACSVPDQRGNSRAQPCDIGAFDLGDVVTVTFVANGGSGTMAPETENSPTDLTSDTFTRAGYSFSGWNTAADGSGTSYSNSATYAFTEPATLYAQWTANPTDNVTFDSEGGSTVGSESGPDGSTITLPPAPSYPGYVFDGWFAAPIGGSALSSPYTLAGSVTLYAQWAAVCSLGYYSTTGGVPCMPAPPGTYVSTSGATSSASCAVGSYNPSSGASSCLVAPPGTYVNTTGAVTTTACALGTFNPNAGATGCTPASVDTYVDAVGATAATNCPVGTYTVTTGSTSAVDCLTPAPTIATFSPKSGPVGTVVTIKGTNLLGASKVTFGGVEGTIATRTATKIKVKVPKGARTGKIEVTTPGGRVKTATAFRVT